MYPTRGQVRTLAQGKLDDPLGLIFTDSVFQVAFQEAYDAMYSAFLSFQCTRIEILTSVVVPAFTTQMTPAQMGITNFGDYIYLSERPLGSNNKYEDLDSVDRLTQRPMFELLREFNYRNDTFYFIGATQNIDLQIKYDTSGVAPTTDSAVIMVDSCSNFLANFAVGAMGPRKGRTQIAAACALLAVGPRYTQGQIGGYLYQLIQNDVRSRQKTQIAPRPYSAQRRMSYNFPVPYIAAQLGTTGSTTPFTVQQSTNDGTLSGTVDGVNGTFYLSIGSVIALELYVNGVLQTNGYDYTALNNQITFQPRSIPPAGAIITAEVTSGPGQTLNTMNVLTASATITPGVVNDGTSVSLSPITVSGAQVGHQAFLTSATPLPASLIMSAQVTAANTVTGYIYNPSGVAVTLGANVFTATVIP